MIGPGATSLIALEGNYKGTPTHPVFPLDGIEKAFGADSGVYAQGAPYANGIALPVPRTAFSGGLHAEFFNGTGFEGTPVATRDDRQIDFDWNAVSPATGVDPNRFSVRWTGFIQVPAAGDYSFQIDDRRCDPSDDHEAYRVRIDGAPEFQASSTCTDFGQPRKTMKVHFSGKEKRGFVLEYTHESPRFSAGITFSWQAPGDVLLEEARQKANGAGVIIACVGLIPWLEGEEMPLRIPGFEGGDRSNLTLPVSQTRLLRELEATGKPVVVVLQSGSSVSLEGLASSAAAILESWYGGEYGGQALGEVLHGDVNPSGHLPVTFYQSASQLPSFVDYSMKGRTYRYFEGKPDYPFGYGLSYTTFAYSGLKLGRAHLKAGIPQTLTVRVKNTGKLAGDSVVELYLSASQVTAPPRPSLRGFTRVHLDPGESKAVSFKLDERELAFADDDGTQRIHAGEYTVWIGGGQPSTNAEGLSGTFTVSGEKSLQP